MVRLELEDSRGVKGILIDGYISDFSYLRQIDWERAMQDKLEINPKAYYYRTLDFERIIDKYLKPGGRELSLPSQVEIYRNLIESIRKRYCPTPAMQNELCAHYFFVTKGMWGTMGLKRFMKYYGKKLWKHHPVLDREMEKDKAGRKKNYAISTLLLNSEPDSKCNKANECCLNWIDFLGFEIKPETDYANFIEFNEAAKALLRNRINFVIEKDFFIL